MDAKPPHQLRDKPRVFRSRRRLLVRIAHAKPAANVHEAQVNARAPKLDNKSSQAADGAAKRRERYDLRTDVRADPSPADPLRIAMRQI